MTRLMMKTALGVIVMTGMLSAGTHRADSHAPIVRQAKTDIADSAAPGAMVPLDMTMKMSMFGMMYGVSDTVTVMGMGSLVMNDMSMQVRATDAIRDSGVYEIGDIKLGTMVRLKKTETFNSHFGMMVSLPTGAVNHSSGGSTVGYGMQPGSGTVDLNPSLTLNWVGERSSAGVQTSALLRTGQNHVGYTLGQKVEATAWWAKVLHQNLSGSLRAIGTIDTGVTGSHDGIPNAAMSIALNPDNTGRKRAMIGLGLNAAFLKWNHFRPSIEVLIPIYEDVTGIQFKTEPFIIFGSTFTY